MSASTVEMFGHICVLGYCTPTIIHRNLAFCSCGHITEWFSDMLNKYLGVGWEITSRLSGNAAAERLLTPQNAPTLENIIALDQAWQSLNQLSVKGISANSPEYFEAIGRVFRCRDQVGIRP